MLIALLLLSGALSVQPARAVYASAQHGRTAFLAARDALSQQDFAVATGKLQEAVAAFTEAERRMGGLLPLRWIPLVATQVRAVDKLLDVGIAAGNAAIKLGTVALHVTAPLAGDDVSFASIPAAQKEEVLRLVHDAQPELEQAKRDLDVAATALDDVPRFGLFGPVADAVGAFDDQLPPLRSSLERALPVVRVLPDVLGYPTRRSYLFLLQNNTELRPTGGFIGTYGILSFENGEIVSFTTKNVYELDDAAGAMDSVPPEPLRRYLAATTWYFRDSNWSPDFPTAAREALRLYDVETKKAHTLDGVIAVTPVFIASLMEATGPLTVQGIRFTAENLVDTLEYEVEIGYAKKGIAEQDRKQIIASLSAQLFNKLLALPHERWNDLWKILVHDVEQKHVLMYLRGGEEQQLVQSLGWGGEVRSTDGDYLFIVDANLASLKTDPGVRRSITYSVARDGEDAVATAVITYRNEGTFNWKSTRYRTYTRVYVPSGSTLLSADGFFTDDKLHNGIPTQPTVGEELGKTVIGGFLSIEPKQERTLTLRYRLPATLAAPLAKGAYSLLLQKQAGTDARDLQLDITAGRRLQSYTPAVGATVDGSTYRLTSTLDKDLRVTLAP